MVALSKSSLMRCAAFPWSCMFGWAKKWTLNLRINCRAASESNDYVETIDAEYGSFDTNTTMLNAKHTLPSLDCRIANTGLGLPLPHSWRTGPTPTTPKPSLPSSRGQAVG